jgi:hypothetical protein
MTALSPGDSWTVIRALAFSVALVCLSATVTYVIATARQDREEQTAARAAGFGVDRGGRRGDPPARFEGRARVHSRGDPGRDRAGDVGGVMVPYIDVEAHQTRKELEMTDDR